ncbi:MAG TPA: hypothetical protein VFT42_06140, partial [Solirubrobacteraceae bacterium]|nr:hypothetical protein [Solirubrobacteraceae bacterium]
MAAEERATFGPAAAERRDALAREWRRLGRVATGVAVVTSPVTFAFFHVTHHWSILWSAVATFVFIVAFRGIVDVVVHRFIPRASLYGAGREILEQDVIDRRRVWYWRARIRNVVWLALIAAIGYGLYRGMLAITGFSSSELRQQFTSSAPSLILLLLQLPLLFLINFGILFGPLLFFGLKQM